jgi:hypothetical protein
MFRQNITILNFLKQSILWDNSEIVERIWDRCCLAVGVRDELRHVEGHSEVQSEKTADLSEKWVFSRLNERMKLLKYGAGHYFKSMFLPFVLQKTSLFGN